MSDIYCSAVSWLGVDWDRCKGSTVAKKIDTPVGVGCGGSSTVSVSKDTVEEEVGKPDVSQDTKVEVPFLDAIIKPEIIETVEEVKDPFSLLGGAKEMWKSKEGYWGTPIIADLDNDKLKEIIVYLYAANAWNSYAVLEDHVSLYVFKFDGSILPGFPIKGLFFHRNQVYYDHLYRDLPVIGDLDGDGKKEIILRTFDDSNDNEQIEAFKADGSVLQGFPMAITDSFNTDLGRIRVADIDGDGAAEIIAAGAQPYGAQNYVLVWKGNGEVYPGFPIHEDTSYDIGIFCGDLDNDKASEIIVEVDSMIHAYKANTLEVAGFPVKEDCCSFGIRFLADINNDGCLDIILSHPEKLLIINCKGEKNVIFPTPPDIIKGGARAMAEMDNDNYPELIYAESYQSSDTNYIYVYTVKENVLSLPGWPLENGVFPYQIVVGNVDEYPDNEIIVGSVGYSSYQPHLKIYKSNGNLLYSHYFSEWGVRPALGDLDNDGKTELVASIQPSGALVVWKFENSTFSSDWPMYGHDPQGSWNYETPIE